jgi:hypothetical protein
MRSVPTRGLVILAALLALAPSARAQAPAAALQIRDDAAHHDMVVEVGPADVAAGDMKQLPAFHGAFPVDGWLHGYRVEMVDAQGRAIPRQTLHHVNVVLPNRRELFSPIMLRLAAAGQETAPAMLPRLAGYRVRPGDPVIVTVMMHNPTARDLRGVRLRLHFPYTRSNAVLRPVSVFPFYMDVMPPASLHSWDLPPGRSSRSWEARPAIAARILGIGGHLHQYGVSLRLEDVTAHRVLWEGRPEVDSTGEVVGMPQKKFIWRLGVPVRPEHVYRVTAEYFNPTGQTIPDGAMGALGGAVVPESEPSWPAADPNNAELKLDWHLVHTGNQGEMRMHMHGPPAGAVQHASMPGMPGMAMPGMAGMAGMDHGSMPMDHGSTEHEHADHGASVPAAASPSAPATASPSAPAPPAKRP